MMSWIFRYLTVMFYGRLYSGASTALHMESVRKLKTGTAALTQIFLSSKHCQCQIPSRKIRESSSFYHVWKMARVVLATASVLATTACGKTETDADRTIDRAMTLRAEITPELLNPKSWVYWCRSGWPDVLSGQTHFKEARDYARKNSLKYLGPQNKPTKINSWPLIFVYADGSSEVVELKKFVFKPVSAGFCGTEHEFVFDVEKGRRLIERAQNE